MKKGNLVNIYISLDEQESILGTLTFYWLDGIEFFIVFHWSNRSQLF